MDKDCIIKQCFVSESECKKCKEKLCEYFYCLVVGSRTFNNYKLMEEKLDYLLQNKNGKVVIVSGGARGADSYAEEYAEKRGYRAIVLKAEWDLYGKSAGYKRNYKMHEYISHTKNRGCVAFWQNESKGTAHNFELAKKFDTPIKIIKC